MKQLKEQSDESIEVKLRSLRLEIHKMIEAYMLLSGHLEEATDYIEFVQVQVNDILNGKLHPSLGKRRLIRGMSEAILKFKKLNLKS